MNSPSLASLSSAPSPGHFPSLLLPGTSPGSSIHAIFSGRNGPLSPLLPNRCSFCLCRFSSDPAQIPFSFKSLPWFPCRSSRILTTCAWWYFVFILLVPHCGDVYVYLIISVQNPWGEGALKFQLLVQNRAGNRVGCLGEIIPEELMLENGSCPYHLLRKWFLTVNFLEIISRKPWNPHIIIQFSQHVFRTCYVQVTVLACVKYNDLHSLISRALVSAGRPQPSPKQQYYKVVQGTSCVVCGGGGISQFWLGREGRTSFLVNYIQREK